MRLFPYFEFDLFFSDFEKKRILSLRGSASDVIFGATPCAACVFALSSVRMFNLFAARLFAGRFSTVLLCR